MEQAGVVKRPIQRSIVLGSALFMLVLAVLLSLIAYFVLSSSVYTRYDTKLKDVITFVEHNADADDLAACIQTGTRSQRYDDLQTLLSGVVDDFELEYLYIVIPESDVMVNVVSATSAAERAAGESDLPLLQTVDAYSPEELARYRSYWDDETIGYFRESSDYGEYYTACKPMRDSNGQTVALICADLSVEALQGSLVTLFAGIFLVALVLLGVSAIAATFWIRRNITMPLLALEQSAQEFASKSHDAEGVSKLEFDEPDIHTQNEVESLAHAITKMATDIRAHVDQTFAAQARVSDAEADIARLAKEAESAAKITELSQSVTSLLNNMPGLTFSKDVQTGVYLACNQAFAEYAHKSDPSGVVGLTDYQIFDAATAQHFVEDDEMALSMDGAYTFFEDVLDGAGNPRQFKTTKMKFYDVNGRLCTLGMCEDVTDLMSARRDTLEARRAYEEARDASLTYYSIARALSADYMRLYYVDLDTDRFTTYHHEDTQEDLLVDQEGEHFFDVDREDVRGLIYPADWDVFKESFTKENVIKSVDELGTYTLSYRITLNGTPTYMGIKASRIQGDDRHLVVGLSNIDAQMKHQEAVKRVQEEQATIERITALSGDFLAIYTIDPDTGYYKAYRMSEAVRSVLSLREGKDFFHDALQKCEKVVHPDDLEMVRSMFNRDHVVSEAKSHKVFVLVLRAVIRSRIIYVSLRAALVEERDGPQLILGISNVDAQMKREREFATAQTRATRDALTGVKNKHAYADAEAALNQQIQAGETMEFGIIVCDLNDLKIANDTKGHQAGDNLLKQACATICTVFKHSPVFRIGGDEFAVILQGYDLEHADELVGELAVINEQHAIGNEAVIAWGMSVYRGDADVAAVFDRADAAMYENKRHIKDGR